MGSRRQLRRAVRALVLTPESRVLLLEYSLPGSGERWLTPGGRVHGNESAEDCVCRELTEETGLRDFELGPLVWRRAYAARRLDHREQFFLVRTAQFEPNAKRMGRKEKSLFRGFRWWSADEIDSSTDRFEPPLISRHLRELLADGPPKRPLDLGRG